MGSIVDNDIEFDVVTMGAKTHDITYVVHGAKIKCTKGDRWARLILPKSHGVFLKGKAQMHKQDYVPIVNVQPMGICSASIPTDEEDIEDIDEEAESGGFFQAAGDAIAATWRSFTGLFRGDDDEEDDDDLDVDLSSAGSICKPEIVRPWIYTNEKVFVDTEEALLSCSVLTCLNGGKITILDDGQNED
jgi:hypothetical protein